MKYKLYLKDGLYKACFQHDMAYGDFKELKKRTAFDKVLRDKAFNIATNPKHDGYQRHLPLWFINFLIKIPLRFQINLYQVLVLLIMRLNKIYN